jgi:outer membrane receptor protein involved in Fe transport
MLYFRPPRAALLFTLLLVGFVCTATADNEPQTISVSAGELGAALRSLAEQTGADIVYRPDQVRGLTTAGVKGTFTARQAAGELLKGTSLSINLDASGSMMISSPAPDAPAENSPLLVFSIPAGTLDAALKLIQDQGHIRVVFASSVVAGKRNQALSGNYTPSDALRRLLIGSDLTANAVNATTYRLSASARTKSASAAGGHTSDGSERVLIEGDRLPTYEAGGNVDIARTIDDAQPYYIFDSATIEDSGALNIEDFLKQRLTMNTVVQTNNQIYGPVLGHNGVATPLGNTSSIDLRGLGTGETLILVDGHRMPSVSIEGSTEQPDINGIPLAAIDRIEVLPSSAAAIYGASAVGGVINVILKKNYSGGDFRYSYENVTQGNAPITTLDGSYGFSAEGGRTHVMITAHYSESQPLDVGDRVALEEQGLSTIIASDPTYFTGNPFSPYLGGTTPNIMGLFNAPLTLKSGTPLNSDATYICPGISPSTSMAALDSCLLANAGKFNLSVLSPGAGPTGLQQPLGYSQRVESAMMTVRRDMLPWLEAFLDVSVESNDGSSVYNPFAGSSYYVPSSSPVNPFQEGVFVSIPNSVATPIYANSINYGASGGFTAHLPSKWTLEMDDTWSQNRFKSLYYDLDLTALSGADSPSSSINSAEPGVLNTGALNPFVDTLAHPLNLQPYEAPYPYTSSGYLNDLALRATGPILTLPWGAPTLAVGLEHRTEGFPSNSTYNNFPLSPWANTSTTYFAQSQSTDSLYAETNVPLISKTNAMPGLRTLELQIADRVERYAVDTGTTSEFIAPGGDGVPPSYCYYPSLDTACQIPVPKSTTHYASNNSTFGVRYKPLDDVTLRASYGTAFLPPTYTQLLPNPQINTNGDYITDPKTGASYSVNTISGGNADLKPEHDLNWDAGLIYQPAAGFLHGLRVDLEYYDIVQFNAIVGPNGDEILDYPDDFPGRVTRNPTTGQVTLINESLVNATKFQTDGWDLTTDYQVPTTIGSFELLGASTLIEHERRQYAVNAPSEDYVGQAQLGGEVKTKINGTLTWRRSGWKVSWTTRWFDSYEAFANPQGVENGSRIPSQIYHDLLVGYAFGKQAALGASNTSVQLGIKDIFNAAPPFDMGFPPFYVSPFGDLRMRDVWLSVRKSF